MSSIKLISTISNDQHGIVARYQLIEAGLSSTTISNRCRSGVLTALYKGVYKSIGSKDSWEQRAVAATLACGRDGYLSHESVLMLFNLLPRNRDRISRRRTNRKKNTLIHVTTARREYHGKNVYFHRSVCLSDYDKSLTHKGIRHVSIERAIIDCAQQLTKNELDYVFDNALSRGLISLARMQNALRTLRTAPGREKKRTIEILDPYFNKKNRTGVESQLEKRIERIISEISSYSLTKQHPVMIAGKQYRIDLAIPEKMIAIEVDGFEFHRSRTKFDDDRRRQNELISKGWKLVRITAAFTDEEICQAFHSILDK